MEIDDGNDGKTTITKGPGNQIIHVRQDSASELEALFNTVMNPNYKSTSLPMKARNLPKSFFQQPERPRNPPCHHSHSVSMNVLAPSPNAPTATHSRSSSSDSSASTLHPTGVSPNANNNNSTALVSQQHPQGTGAMNSNRGHKSNFTMSPAQRRVPNQFANQQNHPTNMSQVTHSRSKSSPASLQLMDVTVKPSDVPPDMPLPPGWSVAKTPDGQQYFMNHNERTTTWEDPRMQIIKQQRQTQLAAMHSLAANQHTASPLATNQHPAGPVPHQQHNSMQNEIAPTLPMGWEQAQTPQGEIYFINHQTKTTSWIDPRVMNMQQQQQQRATTPQVNNPNPQQNNSQLQQQLLKVNQMEMAQQANGSQRGMPPQQQSMLKHLIQEKEILRRQMLKQHSSGVDPFLGAGAGSGAGGSNFHQRDASLDSGVGMGGSNFMSRTPDDFLATANVEDMDTGAGGDMGTRGRGAPHPQQQRLQQQQQQSQHRCATTNHQQQNFPDFLDALPASSVDFPAAVVSMQPPLDGGGGEQDQMGRISGGADDGADFDVDVDQMLSHVKSETIDNGMIWL